MGVAVATLESLCESCGVCPRCALRLNGVKEVHLYEAHYSLADVQAERPCTICLGVLQNKILSQVVEAANPLFENITHDKKLKVTVALPAAASLVRTYAFSAFAQNHHHLDLSRPVSLREAFKWSICHHLEVRTGVRYNADSELFCDVEFTHEETEHEPSALVGEPMVPRKRPRHERDSGRGNHVGHTEVSTATISATQRAIDELQGDELLQILGPSFQPPRPVKDFVRFTTRTSVAPLILAGSYVKLSRRVSQTPWFLDFKKNNDDASAPDAEEIPGRTLKTEVCVQDVVVSRMQEVFNPEKITFTAGGREDLDVRMLGSGRPFIVELSNPNVTPSRVTPEMVASAYPSRCAGLDVVRVQDLRRVGTQYVARMRECEVEKRKRYRCVVWLSREQTHEHIQAALEAPFSGDGLTIHQKTPLRVLHRRTVMVRERRIHEAKVARIVNSRTFILDLVAAAGTYIKEFVHGDNGRTRPNVGELLGCEADILQLDVLGVETDLR